LLLFKEHKTDAKLCNYIGGGVFKWS